MGGGSPGFFRWKSGFGSRGPTHALGKGKYVYRLQDGGGAGFGEGGGSGVSGGDGASVPVHIKCEVGSRTLWFPRATIKVTGSEATVVCEAFDSASGEQVVRVMSKHGSGSRSIISFLLLGRVVVGRFVLMYLCLRLSRRLLLQSLRRPRFVTRFFRPR